MEDNNNIPPAPIAPEGQVYTPASQDQQLKDNLGFIDPNTGGSETQSAVQTQDGLFDTSLPLYTPIQDTIAAFADYNLNIDDGSLPPGKQVSYLRDLYTEQRAKAETDEEREKLDEVYAEASHGLRARHGQYSMTDDDLAYAVAGVGMLPNISPTLEEDEQRKIREDWKESALIKLKGEDPIFFNEHKTNFTELLDDLIEYDHRQVNNQDISKVGDLARRFGNGSISSVAGMVSFGISDRLFDGDLFETNPEFDEDAGSAYAEAFGNALGLVGGAVGTGGLGAARGAAMATARGLGKKATDKLVKKTAQKYSNAFTKTSVLGNAKNNIQETYDTVLKETGDNRLAWGASINQAPMELLAATIDDYVLKGFASGFSKNLDPRETMSILGKSADALNKAGMLSLKGRSMRSLANFVGGVTAKSIIPEAAQEGLEFYAGASQRNAALGYERENILEGVKESATIGGVVGGVIGGASDISGRMRDSFVRTRAEKLRAALEEDQANKEQLDPDDAHDRIVLQMVADVASPRNPSVGIIGNNKIKELDKGFLEEYGLGVAELADGRWAVFQKANQESILEQIKNGQVPKELGQVVDDKGNPITFIGSESDLKRQGPPEETKPLGLPAPEYTKDAEGNVIEPGTSETTSFNKETGEMETTYGPDKSFRKPLDDSKIDYNNSVETLPQEKINQEIRDLAASDQPLTKQQYNRYRGLYRISKRDGYYIPEFSPRVTAEVLAQIAKDKEAGVVDIPPIDYSDNTTDSNF